MKMFCGIALLLTSVISCCIFSYNAGRIDGYNKGLNDGVSAEAYRQDVNLKGIKLPRVEVHTPRVNVVIPERSDRNDNDIPPDWDPPN